MKTSTLQDLVCPQIQNGKKCRGAFSSHVLKRKKDEILYGLLTCAKCGTKYPVIHGIPVLLSDLKKYFTDNFGLIKEAISPKSKNRENLFLYMSVAGRSAFHTKESGHTINVHGGHGQQKAGGYQLLHYGNLLTTTHTPLVRDLLKLHKKKNAYVIIKDWLSKKNLKDKKAVDVGCSAGGLTHLLAGKCSFTYGVDLSFTDLLSASMTTKHVPSKLSSYKVKENGRIKTKKTKIKKTDNIDFVLASGDNLPFKDNLFEVSISSSVLDIAANNVNILREAGRTLKKNGELFLSFVPLFRKLQEGKKGVDLTASNIKKATKSIAFYREFKHIPFILRNTENFYNLYDNYCMLGRKK